MSPQIRPRQLAQDAPLLMVACGLALRRFDDDPHQPAPAPRAEARRRAAAVRLAGDRPRRSSALAIVALVHVVLADQIENQNSRNALLKTEIAKLDKQIEEIDKLREQTLALLARKQVVETLQTNRTEAVHLLDQLVRQLPDGIYLRSVKQTDTKVTLDRLRAVERARLDADAQHRELALAREARAGRDQGGAAAEQRGRA